MEILVLPLFSDMFLSRLNHKYYSRSVAAVKQQDIERNSFDSRLLVSRSALYPRLFFFLNRTVADRCLLFMLDKTKCFWPEHFKDYRQNSRSLTQNKLNTVSRHSTTMNTQSQYGYSYLKPTLYYNNSNINIDNNLYLY